MTDSDNNYDLYNRYSIFDNNTEQNQTNNLFTPSDNGDISFINMLDYLNNNSNNTNSIQQENLKVNLLDVQNFSEQHLTELNPEQHPLLESLQRSVNNDIGENIANGNNNTEQENNGNELHQNSNDVKETHIFKVCGDGDNYIPLFTVEKYIIHFKKRFGQWYVQTINQILRKQKRRKKFYRFDTKKFTSIGTIDINKSFLSKTCIDLLNFSSPKKRSNELTIQSIKKYPKKYGKELWHYLKLPFEKCIIEFYHSENFTKFKNEVKTKRYDSKLSKLYNFSFITEEGFTEFIKKRNGNSTYKQKKINFSN